MYSYAGLTNELKKRNMTKSSLADKPGISSRTIAKIGRGEKISDAVLGRIAEYLGVDASELMKWESENLLLNTLREEKRIKLPGGLYHELQVRMTYNSNHIEGSRLTEEQTRMIYETNTIGIADSLPVDDIIETANHFRAVDYVIDVAEEPLTEEIIKHLHLLLKQNTKDSTLDWFNVGEYKKKANTVGGRQTVKPKDVSSEIDRLLSAYSGIENVSFEDIVAFHHDFECIHPFQDGNGRVGRLIALKECLRFNIIPFIIEDTKKMFYYRGLAEWDNEKGYLIDTCLDGQDTFKNLMSLFDD